MPGVSESGISWKTDRDHKFKNNADGTSGNNAFIFDHERSQSCASLPTIAERTACTAADIPEAGWCYPGSGYCFEDEHFIVWMVRRRSPAAAAPLLPLPCTANQPPPLLAAPLLPLLVATPRRPHPVTTP